MYRQIPLIHSPGYIQITKYLLANHTGNQSPHTEVALIRVWRTEITSKVNIALRGLIQLDIKATDDRSDDQEELCIGQAVQQLASVDIVEGHFASYFKPTHIRLPFEKFTR